jgi:hypothetical protein
MAGYYEALAQGQRSGRPGKVVPRGTGTRVTYEFIPTGPPRSSVGRGGQFGGINYQSLLADFEKREKAAREANIAREQEIRGTYGDIIGRLEEGGAFKEAGLADIERTKTRAIGAGTQQMISSGLYGTTTAASIPVRAEAEAGVSRLKLEDILEQRVTEAKKARAGFVERIEDPYPDYNMLMQAYMSQARA